MGRYCWPKQVPEVGGQHVPVVLVQLDQSLEMRAMVRASERCSRSRRREATEGGAMAAGFVHRGGGDALGTGPILSQSGYGPLLRLLILLQHKLLPLLPQRLLLQRWSFSIRGSPTDAMGTRHQALYTEAQSQTDAQGPRLLAT